MTNRRQSILDAALTSYDETGAVSIDEVKRHSGASVGSIYHRFGGKHGIAAALYVEILRGYQDGFLRALDRAPDAEAGIKALVRFHLRWVERHPAEARFLLQGGVRRAADEDLRELNRRTFAAVEEWIGGQAQIRSLPRDVLYAVVIGPAQEASRHWLAGRMKSLRKLENDLAESAWRAIREEPE